MAINPNNGVLDIINGTLKVSSIDIKQTAGFTTAINTVARNDVLLFDDQKSTTVFTPTALNGYMSSTGVTRDTSSNYLELGTASDGGWVYWPLQLPNSWHTEFDMHVTATGGVLTFSLFNTSEPNHTDYTNNDGGYKIVFDNTNNQIVIYWEGSIHKTVSATLRSNDWQHVNINYFQGAVSISLAGKVILTHEFTQNYQEFESRYIGFSATSGTSHKIRHLRVHNSDKWLYTKTSNASDITYVSGNVGIGSLTPTELLDVHGNVHIAKDLTVDGNLTVSGTTTFIDSTNLAVEDPIIELARGNASDTIDAGLIVTRGTSNVAVAYRGDEEELALGYTQSGASDTDVTPIADGGLDVRVYGNLFANNLTTTANVEATYVKGDGSELTQITLDQVVGYANTTGNTVQLTNTDVGLVATGNVEANYFVGDGSRLTGLVTTLEDVANNGNTMSNTIQFTNATTAFVADSNVGIGTDAPTANLHVMGYQYVNDPPTIANSFDHSDAPLTLTHGTVTSADPKPILHLTREGTSGQAYGARASFNLSRYENSGTASRSRLDLALADGTYAESTVMTLRADGNVGVGTTSPGYTLDVHGSANVGALTATTISGPLSGNASTATALETARTIGGVSFDGTANINLPGVNTTGNQDTSGNAATADQVNNSLTPGSYLTGSAFNGSAAQTFAVDATTGNVGNKIVARDASGHINFTYGFSSYLNMSHGVSGATGDTIFYSSYDNYIRKNNATGFRASLNVPTRTGGDASGTWGISITGNAATATVLQTARNINGVSFNGSGNITVNGLNYNVNDGWLRENGDNATFKQYGNSRQMVFRTDGTTEYASGVGGYPFAWMYGGDAASNRRMLLNTSGQLWCSNYGWLHDKFAYKDGSNSPSGTWGINITGNADTVDNLHASSFLRSDADDTVNAGVTYSWSATNTEGLKFQNSSYTGYYLYIGGWTSTNSNNISRIRNSSGNLHIDSAANGNLYLNWYSGGSVEVGSYMHITNNLAVDGNANHLGNGNGDYTWVNDTFYVGASDSGDSHIFFGENSSSWYGEHWYWDSGHTTNRYSRHAGTDTLIERHDTRYTHKIQTNRAYERLSHSTGYQIGSYNSVGANDAKSNPIYVIGDNYRPSDTALSNMYGIGYSHGNFTSILSGGWGMYVASDGDARIGLNAEHGNIKCTGAIYCGGTVFVGGSTSRGLRSVSGNYGTVQTTGGGAGGYEGYSIDGRYVFMSADNNQCGIYNDLDNHWMIYCTRGGYVQLRYNNATKLQTNSGGVTVTGTVTATTFSGTATVANSTNGNGKIVVQNGTNGGNSKGIWMWTSTDSNWGIYMGQSGSGRSLSGGTANYFDSVTSHAIRFRVSNNSANGFIFENNSEHMLLGLRASDGYLVHYGPMYNSGTLESDGRIYADNGLHVRGDWLRVNGNNGLYFESHGGGWHMQDSTWVRLYNNKHLWCGNAVVGTNYRIGVGTSNPRVPMHVYGTGDSLNNGSFRYMAVGGSGSGYGTWGALCASFEGGHVRSTDSFLAHNGSLNSSDERIKKEISDIDDASALETLRLIQPKTYKYKDEEKMGSDVVYGFIAQQIQEVLPYATKTLTDYLPSIREMSNVTQSNVITFTNFNTNDLLSNTTIIQAQLFKGENKDLTISEIIDEHSIRVEEDLTEMLHEDDTRLYIYGEQVDDFVFLKKESIFTIATAALQEVDRQLQAEKAKVATLETQLASVLARLDALENPPS